MGCFFAMVISFEFRMGQHRDGDHGEHASQFTSSSQFRLTHFRFMQRNNKS